MSDRTDTDSTAPGLPWALQNFVSLMFPQGGQGQARRNAWAAMCTNQVRAWERAEAQRVLEPLARRHAAVSPQEPPQPRALAL